MRNLLFQGRRLILRDAEQDRNAAGLLHCRRNAVTVRVDDLVLAEPLVEIGQLVARGQDRHARPLIHEHERLGEDREHARFGWPDLRALGDDAVAFLDVLALRTDVGSAHLGLEDLHRVRCMLGILDFDDRVGSFWDRRTRHDADRLPGPDGLSRRLARRYVLDHFQRDRFGDGMLLLDVLPPYREAVHRRIVPRRIVALRDDVLPEHTAQRVQDGDLLQAERRGRLEDHLLRFM
ncbi:MAG: hypothetical protein KatS3mg082_1264 [Nitrospiraceae bacterium]|nr:MAG: hypothetical protein KatS3mg082_1264 [Nitrospiraceae bacterium]